MSKSLNSFDELASMREGLKAQAEAKEAERKKQEEIRRKKAETASMFLREMDKIGVQKLDLAKDRHPKNPPLPDPIPFQKFKDDKQVLEDSLSDEFGIDHLLDSDERLSYYSKTASPDLPRKLRRGVWSIKGSLDLHGYTVPEARLILSVFLDSQKKAGNRVLRIIHGQGYGSVGRKPVLKEKVPIWLIQRKDVLAFVQAPDHDGGAGALLVMLASN